MKVINLLNKIENGESVPRKIVVNGEKYEWDTLEHYYENDDGEDLLELSRRINTKDLLNMPVELIEDEIDIQAIEELSITEYYLSNNTLKINEILKAIKQLDRKIKEKE